jgi:hypothetical protein
MDEEYNLDFARRRSTMNHRSAPAVPALGRKMWISV